MKNLKVRTKLSILLAVVVIAMIGLSGMAIIGMSQIQSTSVEIIKDSISQDYDDQIRNEVETAFSICDTYYGLYQAGAMTLDEAKNWCRKYFGDYVCDDIFETVA